MNPNRCTLHPDDRKPFPADHRLVTAVIETIARGESPAFGNANHATQTHAERMYRLDAILANAQFVAVCLEDDFELEVRPDGIYDLCPRTK